MSIKFNTFNFYKGYLVYVVLLFSGVVSGHAAVLMMQDKINFGTVLPFLLGTAGLLWCWRRTRWNAYLNTQPRLASLWRWSLRVFLVWLLSLSVFFVWVVQEQTQGIVPNLEPTVIVILGSGLRNNQASPTLQNRLDVGLIEAKRYPTAKVLTSGGLGLHQTLTEAQVMADYLIKHGLDRNRLLLENRSTSTYENLLFSKDLLTQLRIGIAPQQLKVLIVSSDFHLIRAHAIAQRVGLPIAGMVGAPTPLIIRYNARLREYFAFISGWLLNEY